MSANDKVFVGSIPSVYDSHMAPMLFQPYAADLAARVSSFAPETVLETAAGTGVLTAELLTSLGRGAQITVTDLNQAMLDVATTKLPAGSVRVRACDAMQLPFEAQSYDAVVCQFGVMFFPDKNVAYKEARRVLREGGHFFFNVWDSLDTNDFAAVVHETVAKVFPDDPPAFFARTPHGYHDTPSISASLSTAGFRQSAVHRVKLVSKAPDAMYVATAYCQGTPMRNEIESRAPGQLNEITRRVAEAVETRFGKGPVEAPMQAYVFEAQS